NPSALRRVLLGRAKPSPIRELLRLAMTQRDRFAVVQTRQLRTPCAPLDLRPRGPVRVIPRQLFVTRERQQRLTAGIVPPQLRDRQSPPQRDDRTSGANLELIVQRDDPRPVRC